MTSPRALSPETRATGRRGFLRARRPVLVVAALALLATAGACTTTDVSTLACMADGRSVVTVPADHGVPYPGQKTYGRGTTFDARGRVFNSGNTTQYLMKVHRDQTGDDACVVGGQFATTMHPENTPWDTWHGHKAVIVQEEDFHMVGSRFYNVGDMISFNWDAYDWRLTGIAAEPLGSAPGAYVHDDCIENDRMNAGIVEDSKLDGCNVFMSSSGSQADGSRNTVEVRDTLVRLQGFHNSYNTTKYGFGRHGGFFKWSPRPAGGGLGTPPNLYVHDSIFRADTQGAYGGPSTGFLALPPGSRCHDVTLVAKGGWGPDPANPTHPGWMPRDIRSWKEQCTNLTFADESVWDAAVERWDATHPAP